MTNTARAISLRNAFNFVIDSVEEGHSISDIRDLDINSLEEFADINNTESIDILRACQMIDGEFGFEYIKMDLAKLNSIPVDAHKQLREVIRKNFVS